MTPEKQAICDDTTRLLNEFVEEIEDWSARYLAAMEDVATRVEAAGFTAGEFLDLTNSWAALMARIEALT